MRNSIFVSVLLVLAGNLRSTQGQSSSSYCYTDDPRPYVKFSTKTAYRLARGQVIHDEIVPQGCEASQVWHLLRHGTRYPDDDDSAAFIKELPTLQADILQASQAGRGELCEGDVLLLEEWSLGDFNVSWSSRLALEGEKELEGIGIRYKVNLPSLLNEPFSNDSFKFRHTATERTEASAEAYARGLFGDFVYMPAPLNPDPLLEFYKVCDKYVTEVEENPDATLESHLFQMGPVMDAVVNRVSQRLGLQLTFQKVEVMYNACRFYKAWDPSSDSAWCAVFTHSDLQVLEDWQDLEKYYTDGYGHAINYEMACPPLQDVIQYFSDVVDGRGGPNGIFYFTHSKAVITMMSRLGLYRDAAPLTHEHMDPARRWHTSSHGIFATNLAFVLSSCGQDRWWVSVLMSEKVVSLAGCSSDRGCTWDEFRAAYGRYQRCDFDDICQASVQEEESSSSAGNRPEVVWGTSVVRFLRALTWWAGDLFT